MNTNLEELLKEIFSSTSKKQTVKNLDIEKCSDGELSSHLDDIFENIDLADFLKKLYKQDPELAAVINAFTTSIAKLARESIKQKMKGIFE